ncbi:MAG: ABC transporter substrate-binding protein [Planctomycetota bacterium]|nr:ABC transporter substrate-binding protein [Planctomycetota bacterium]
MKLGTTLLLQVCVSAALLAQPLLASPQEGTAAASDGAALSAERDFFHPDRAEPSTPRYGGRVIVHLPSLVKHINYATENSAYTRRILYEVHESLLLQDWESHKYVPRLATQYPVIEDALAVTAEAKAKYTTTDVVLKRKVVEGEQAASEFVTEAVVYGEVIDEGDFYTVRPVSFKNPLTETIQVPKADAKRLEKGTVFNFELRDDVRWHPGGGHTDQMLDADDVHFSWSIYRNPEVNCDEKRFQFIKVTGAEVLDKHHIRFFYEQQYAYALATLGDSMTILPSHVYNLADPDNQDHKKNFTEEEQGTFINEHQANKNWIGLGPYRITNFSDQYVEASRFVDDQGKSLYFDPEHAGYMDTIRYRVIRDDQAAMRALLNEELDFFERVKSEDYFGPATQKDDFTKAFYKGYFYLGSYGYTGWNMYRPQLADLAVRKAISMAFDSQAFLRTNYKGLARKVTGPFPVESDAYNREVAPLTHDVDMAIELLDDAGWYDRNGDGTRDKDGVELVITVLYPTGNDASKILLLKLQESLAELEIDVQLEPIEWASFLERINKRDYDGCNLAWLPGLEDDPEQLWHSKWGAKGVEGSNHSGVMDPYIDDLIAKGQVELDFEKRMALWNKLHEHLYNNVMPCLFGFNVPRKFAMSKGIRGYQTFAISPGWSIRRWYFADPAKDGTRATLNK